ncbi:hypothetical protein ACVPOS_16815 [Staphylococcus aureus]
MVKRKLKKEHRHRSEFNNDYREQLEANGMVISGTSPDEQYSRNGRDSDK